MIEIIDNHVLPNIPTKVYEEGCTVLKGFEMQSSRKVNLSLIGINALMTGSGWSDDEIIKANSNFQIDLPVVGQAGPFDLIILWLAEDEDADGQAFRIFNPTKDPPDVDPTGNTLSGVGPKGQDSIIVGVPVNSEMGQNEIIQALIAKMSEALPNFSLEGRDPIEDPDNALYGIYTHIYIEAKTGGAEWNDVTGVGNVVGGGQFNSATKNGGYDLRSPPNGDNRLKFTMWNNSTSNFTFRAHFLQGPRGNPESRTITSVLQDRVLHKRTNYICFVGPRQWGIFPEEYLPWSPSSVLDTTIGTSDYHFCGPRVPDEQSNEAIVGAKAILYTGFMMATPRDRLNENGKCATCVNDKFQENSFTAGVDAGVVYLAYNSMFHSAGALRTTSGKTLKYSAIICLSPGNSFFNRSRFIPQEEQLGTLVYAFVPDMYLTTEAVPLNTIVVDPISRRNFMAYRVQTAPCECTLWLGMGG